MYADIQELIRRFNVAFRRHGTGASPIAIEAAQRTLGVALPPSYAWWLAHYGGGQIGGDVVLGIDPEGLGPDLLTVRQRRPGGLVFYLGNEEEFFFDTSLADADGEYPVMLAEDGGEAWLYASSFADFLRRRIPEVYGSAQEG